LIWVNEQLDPGGLIYACLATCDTAVVQECHANFTSNLSPEQRARGWQARLRTVEFWEQVSVTTLQLS
jgi:hypothetical protein